MDSGAQAALHGPRPTSGGKNSAAPTTTTSFTVRHESKGSEALAAEELKAKDKVSAPDLDALLQKKPEATSGQAVPITHTERSAPKTLAPLMVRETIQQVREAFVSLIGQAGIHTAALTLADESLGDVRIKVSSRGKRINAEITASDEAVRSLLRTHRQEFELAVTQKGFELGSFLTGSDSGGGKQAHSPTTHAHAAPMTRHEAAPSTGARPSLSSSGLDVVI